MFIHPLDDVIQGRKLFELQIFVARYVVRFAHSCEGLGLFDRVDAQVGFQVEIQVEHIGWIAGLARDHLEHLGGDRIVCTGRRSCGVGRRGLCRQRCSRC